MLGKTAGDLPHGEGKSRTQTFSANVDYCNFQCPNIILLFNQLYWSYKALKTYGTSVSSKSNPRSLRTIEVVQFILYRLSFTLYCLFFIDYSLFFIDQRLFFTDYLLFFIDYCLFFIDYLLLFIDSRSLFINYLFILYFFKVW